MIKKIGCHLLCLFLLLYFSSCGAPAANSDSDTILPPSQLAATSTSESGNALEPLSFYAPENWLAPHPKSLTQGWCEDYGLGALMPARYLFQDDGTFYYTENEYAADIRVRYMDGTWEYGNSVLHLTVKRKLVVEGGVVNSNVQGGSRAAQIDGGVLMQYVLSPEECEGVDLPIDSVEGESDTSGLPDFVNGIILLDGVEYYAAPGIGYDDMLTYWDDYVYVA